MALPVLSQGLNSYLVEINRYPLLTRDEEYSLARRWKDERDIDAAHTLVTSNLRFVVKIALEFRDYGFSLRDLIQEGNIGLMHAVKKFDPDKGARLITYAVWWIKSHIQDYILRTKGLVRRGGRALKKALFYKGELSASTEAPQDFSLDSSIGEDGDATHLDMLSDESYNQETLVAESQTSALVKADVAKALTVLNKNERFVVENRIMGEEEKSLQEIGDSLGISRERVRQIEASAMKKLKKALIG